MVKNPPANTGDAGDMSSIPGVERSPGGGHGNPLEYSCLENPIDKGACQGSCQGVARVGLSDLVTKPPRENN